MLILSAVIYNNSDCRYFALFTRRLVLDFGLKYSVLSDRCQYALEALPSMFFCNCAYFHEYRARGQPLRSWTVLLEEQRKGAWMEFHNKLPKLADRRCWDESCKSVGTGLNFPGAVVEFLPSENSADMRWPPHKKPGLREFLQIICSRGDVTVEFSYRCCHLQSNKVTVKGQDLRDLCHDVSRIACGLRLTCLDEQSIADEHCEHEDFVDDWVRDDPLMQ
ncbi:hypothetical protein MBLNU13_g07376t1 [Cladosporium sp. NU13]